MVSILCIVTSSADADRAKRLSAALGADITFTVVDKAQSRKSEAQRIFRMLSQRKWDLVYLEGTGLAGGIPLICSKYMQGTRYIFSSGDPIANYFRIVKGPLAGLLFRPYESLLYKNAAGYIGRTPYLSGLALELGAPCVASIEAVDLQLFRPAEAAERADIRRRLGFTADTIVCGMIGTIKWSDSQKFAYGYELVQSIKQTKRRDVAALIVGDGSGLARLKELVPEGLDKRIVFTGRLERAQAAEMIKAIDIGFVSQTLDVLGKYRYTTKMGEYLACGVPVAMTPVPGFFDIAFEAGWALPAVHPGSEQFHLECASWLDKLTTQEIQDKARHARNIAERHFDYDKAERAFKLFVEYVLKNRD